MHRAYAAQAQSSSVRDWSVSVGNMKGVVSDITDLGKGSSRKGADDKMAAVMGMVHGMAVADHRGGRCRRGGPLGDGPILNGPQVPGASVRDDARRRRLHLSAEGQGETGLEVAFLGGQIVVPCRVGLIGGTGLAGGTGGLGALLVARRQLDAIGLKRRAINKRDVVEDGRRWIPLAGGLVDGVFELRDVVGSFLIESEFHGCAAGTLGPAVRLREGLTMLERGDVGVVSVETNLVEDRSSAVVDDGGRSDRTVGLDMSGEERSSARHQGGVLHRGDGGTGAGATGPKDGWRAKKYTMNKSKSIA